MAVLGLLTSAVYLAIAHGLGMPITLAWKLWLYGALAISAVGITSSSLIAVLGSMGALFSMLVFIVLGLPSAGATVPLEAVPPFFATSGAKVQASKRNSSAAQVSRIRYFD